MRDVGSFDKNGKWESCNNPTTLIEFRKQNIGNRLILTIEEYKKDRSINQNSYMWGVVYGHISQYTGMTPNEVHEWCKMEFNFGFKEVLNKNTGELKEIKYGKSTKDLDTGEMENYLEEIRRYFMIEFNVYIPIPNETI
jgi:hypothetical protein